MSRITSFLIAFLIASPIAAQDEKKKRDWDGMHPEWKYVVEGKGVELQGRKWNTRKADGVENTENYGVVAQRNGTATLLGEAFQNRGKVEWEAWYETGVLEVGGGGKHFHEVMSYVSDRAGKFRQTIRKGWTSRIEIASLADRPRCIVWNYGPDFDSKASAIVTLGKPPKENEWIKWALQWNFDPDTAVLEFMVTRGDQSYSGKVELKKGTEGPGRFFLHGHVETESGKGRIRFRNFKVSPLKNPNKTTKPLQ